MPIVLPTLPAITSAEAFDAQLSWSQSSTTEQKAPYEKVVADLRQAVVPARQAYDKSRQKFERAKAEYEASLGEFSRAPTGESAWATEKALLKVDSSYEEGRAAFRAVETASDISVQYKKQMRALRTPGDPTRAANNLFDRIKTDRNNVVGQLNTEIVQGRQTIDSNPSISEGLLVKGKGSEFDVPLLAEDKRKALEVVRSTPGEFASMPTRQRWEADTGGDRIRTPEMREIGSALEAFDTARTNYERQRSGIINLLEREPTNNGKLIMARESLDKRLGEIEDARNSVATAADTWLRKGFHLKSGGKVRDLRTGINLMSHSVDEARAHLRKLDQHLHDARQGVLDSCTNKFSSAVAQTQAVPQQRADRHATSLPSSSSGPQRREGRPLVPQEEAEETKVLTRGTIRR